MISEPYSPGHTLLHRADVRVKLAATGMIVCIASLLHTMQASLAALGIGFAALALARISPMDAARRLATANCLLLMLAVSLALTYPGTAWGPWSMVRVEGAALGLRIALKGNAALCLLLALSATSSVAAISRGLRRLGLPEKLVLLLAFSYRQIFVTTAEWERRRQALAARCFTPCMSMHTWRTVATLFGQTLLGSLDRADRIRDAMRARCFDGVFHVLDEPCGSQTETTVLALGALLCAATLLALDLGWI